MYEPNERYMLPVLYQCQARGCVRAALPSQEVRRWWLIAPSKDNPRLLIIRCPEHQTEWALRQTVYGRLTALRRRAKKARQQQLPRADITDPYLTMFIGARREFGEWDDIPDPREFMDMLGDTYRVKWEWSYGPEYSARIKKARKRSGVQQPARDWHGQFQAPGRIPKQTTKGGSKHGRRKIVPLTSGEALAEVHGDQDGRDTDHRLRGTQIQRRVRTTGRRKLHTEHQDHH